MAMRPLALALLLLAACGGGGDGTPTTPGTPLPSPDQPAPPAPSGLAALSDEFDDPTTWSDWSRVFHVEGWGFDQLESADIGATEAGHLTLVPYASSWYEEWRGVLVFKPVQGDFVVTTQLRVANRADDGAPGSLYSLAGIMIRKPRAITPATWTPNGEDYVFHSMGAANTPGTWQTEVKTTDDSTSVLEIHAGGPEATLRSARIGPHLILLIRWPGQAWQIHRRYHRTDLPQTLQVGLTTYTDWATCEAAGVTTHNTTLLVGGQPDLQARADYVRFAPPEVPAGLVGADLSNPAAVTDAALLGFLAFD